MTKDIAERLVELGRLGQFAQAQDELYSQDAVSIEPHESPGFAKETKGLAAIKEKGKKWNDMLEETHSIDVSDPIIAPNSFAVSMKFDVTMKGHGRTEMSEICVYEIKDDRIVSERFYM